MLSIEAINNFRYFCIEIMSPAEDPRSWIEFWVNREKPHLKTQEVIDQLLSHLDDFLCISEMYENLDLGGVYTCKTIWQGCTTKWKFEYSQDNPGRASLILRALPVEMPHDLG